MRYVYNLSYAVGIGSVIMAQVWPGQKVWDTIKKNCIYQEYLEEWLSGIVIAYPSWDSEFKSQYVTPQKNISQQRKFLDLVTQLGNSTKCLKNNTSTPQPSQNQNEAKRILPNSFCKDSITLRAKLD
jgi:hypothetical protein